MLTKLINKQKGPKIEFIDVQKEHIRLSCGHPLGV